MTAFLLRLYARRSAPVEVPPDHVLDVATALAGWRALVAGGGNGVLWLGHAAFLIRIGGLTVLTDPWLDDWAAPRPGLGPKRYVPPGIPVGDLPPVDVLLLSHNHYDHLCLPTLRKLPGKERMLALTPLGVGRYLKGLGFARLRELDWQEEVTERGVRLTCLPAIHQSARTAFDRNRTLWAGYALDDGRHRICFGGDSGYGPVFAETGARHGPFDLAIIGIGAYEPRGIMRAVHTTPEEAVDIARDLRADRILGMHWGTVVLTEEPPFEPPVRFRAAAAAAGYDGADAWLLKIGETRALPSGVRRTEG